MLCYSILCHAVLCYATLCYDMRYNAMLHYATICMLYYTIAMLCYTIICYATLYCYAMLLYYMLLYATLSYAIVIKFCLSQAIINIRHFRSKLFHLYQNVGIILLINFLTKIFFVNSKPLCTNLTNISNLFQVGNGLNQIPNYFERS